jgi:hypothetical protein
VGTETRLNELADQDGPSSYLQSTEEVLETGTIQGGVFVFWSVGIIWRNRAKISVEEPGVASCRQLLYQQGAHTYSTRFYSGWTKSFSAQAVKPPVLRRYTRPLLLWDFGIFFAVFWGSAGLRAIARDPGSLGVVKGPIGFLVCFGLICFPCMILSFRKIARYNREIYPRLK